MIPNQLQPNNSQAMTIERPLEDVVVSHTVGNSNISLNSPEHLKGLDET